MQQLKYISPTSLSLWCKNKEDFYMQYLADIRAPRGAQTRSMSIGSAFDAYVKSHLHQLLFGKGHDLNFELATILEKQVSTQHLCWAREHGLYVFQEYQKSGALADIMLELNSAIGPPRFEFEVQGKVKTEATIDGVVFLGKPDIFYTSKGGANVTFDWKVNGYCVQYPQSPKPGFVGLKPGFSMHPDCDLKLHKGMRYNAAKCLESVDEDWANQLSIYAWLCGQPVGTQFIAAVDQVVCNTKNLTLMWPQLRFAQHRMLISEGHQNKLFNVANTLWTNIAENHIFRDMSKDESISRCQLLDQLAKDKWGTDTESEEDRIFREMTTIPRHY